MTDLQAVRETVESRFSEMQPVDRYGQLNQFRFKVAERDKSELIPFSSPGPRANGPLVLKDHALRQLCARIGVPYSFFNKCPPALQEFNVAWFMQNMDKEKDVMLRIVKGNEVRAIVSDRYAPFDDIELFRILAEFMDGTEEVKHMPNHRYQGPYRQSLLKLYSECPRKFKALNVDCVEVKEAKSAPLMIGANVHRLIHSFHQREPIDWRRGEVPYPAWEQVMEMVNAYTNNNRALEIGRAHV